MPFKRLGWFTSARDEAAWKLFEVVWQEIKRGFLPVKLSYVFISAEPEEGPWAKKIYEEAKAQNIKVVCLSARKFLPELRTKDREAWRVKYHQEVLKILPEEVEIGILAGYMWITSEEFCNSLFLINLHPALPGGPKGTWQEVIWQLISARACETGVMMHKVPLSLTKVLPLLLCAFL